MGLGRRVPGGRAPRIACGEPKTTLHTMVDRPGRPGSCCGPVQRPARRDCHVPLQTDPRPMPHRPFSGYHDHLCLLRRDHSYVSDRERQVQMITARVWRSQHANSPWLKGVVIATGGISSALGLALLIGWYAMTLGGTEAAQDLVPMPYTAVLAFLGCGAGLLAFALDRRKLVFIFGANRHGGGARRAVSLHFSREVRSRRAPVRASADGSGPASGPHGLGYRCRAQSCRSRAAASGSSAASAPHPGIGLSRRPHCGDRDGPALRVPVRYLPRRLGGSDPLWRP
jgi:hypothetical protein